jgi:glycosyltransferase involved in cell wall biosynthesis
LGERFLGGFVQRQEARLLGATARHVIAPSAKVKREIARHYGREAGVTVVPHGFRDPRIDADRKQIDADGSHIVSDERLTSREDARRRLNLPQGPVLAMFVGDVRKGLHAAITAVAQVEDIHLGIVSYSSPADTSERAREAGVADRVHWLGAHSDISLAMHAADMLVHPTIYDSFGLVVAEAMAHGIPAVVTTNAGVSELIKHRESGWIVDGDAAEGTALALRELAGDKELRERIGLGAKQVAESRTWDDVARETMKVYEEAGRERRPC